MIYFLILIIGILLERRCNITVGIEKTFIAIFKRFKRGDKK
jgi:hypothetical protein